MYVYPIDINNPFDGFSGITDPNDSTTHIRPLYDFLLLTSNATYLVKLFYVVILMLINGYHQYQIILI